MTDEDRDIEDRLAWRRSVSTLRLIEQARTGPAAASAKTKRVKDADARAVKARAMRASGMTYKEIATALDCDVSTVPRLLKRPV